MSVLVVGSMAYDSVETADRTVEHALGGSATFFSMASSLFAPTEVVAVVGDDFDSKDFERLRRRGVGLSGVERLAGRTFRWGGRYSRYFETRETLFTELNVFERFDPDIPAALRNPDILFLANIHPRLQLNVLDQVEPPRFVALDTMNFWISAELDDLKAVLGRVDLLMLNDEEAFQLSGIGNLRLAAERILQMGPRWLVIKRGEHGAWLFDGDVVSLVPAVPLRKVVDPTGAGDSFAGGFAGYLHTCEAIDREALLGGLVAGTLCASYGVQGFSVDRLEQIDRADLRERHAELQAFLGGLHCTNL